MKPERSSRAPRLAVASSLTLTWALPLMVLLCPAATASSAIKAEDEVAGQTAGAPSQSASRLYTNADLDKFARESTTRRDTVTNAHLKAALPSQKAPLVEASDWDFVFKFLDREHALEEERRKRDLEYAALALAAAQSAAGPSYVSPYPFYYPGFPFLDGARFVKPVPSNPFAPLRQRGIGTAVDLNREQVRDSQIRRSDVMP
jgi:hypothetical protein